MTHKLMEMLVSSGNRINADEAVSEILREFCTPESEKYETKLKEALIIHFDRVLQCSQFPDGINDFALALFENVSQGSNRKFLV